jgi:hypothetical protein
MRCMVDPGNMLMYFTTHPNISIYCEELNPNLLE